MKPTKNESVKVALRVRPLNKRELGLNSPVCVSTEENVLSIRKQNTSKDFIFDYVFKMQCKQGEIYETCAFSIVQNALQGFNGTIFAYGQTGSGKTFTMTGDYKDSEWKGIIPRGFEHIVTAIQTSQERRYVVRASFTEIYNEDIYDLLDGKGDTKKDLKESPQTGVFVKDLKTVPVKSVEELLKILAWGDKNRSKAETAMNAASSRSHTIFTVHIQSLEGNQKVKASKLNLVDLAGSQRQAKTQATSQTLKEGAKINLSLTALGNVINALVDGKKNGHIPYRDSKLTRLLQDSLGGNTKTLMIASVSPAQDNYDESVSTLRYASRARNIKNAPKVNQDPKDAMIREYLEQIENLKKQLSSGGSGGALRSGDDLSDEQLRQLEQRANRKQKQLNEKEKQLLQMKKKLQQMQGLILKKDITPEQNKKAQKRKLEKKKIMINEEINSYKVHELEDEQNKQVEEESKSEDINYWKALSGKLRKKLKTLRKDNTDLQEQFEDERQRLNESIRNIETQLSFYKQIAEKFLSEKDFERLRQRSILSFQKRQYVIPSFLIHQEKLTLPKFLKKNQIEDLWNSKRQGNQLQIIDEPLPDIKIMNEIGQSKSEVYRIDRYDKLPPKNSKTIQKQPQFTLLQSRRFLKQIEYWNQVYQQKDYSDPAQLKMFDRTRKDFRLQSRQSRSRSRNRSREKQQFHHTYDDFKQLQGKDKETESSTKRSLFKEKLKLSPIESPSKVDQPKGRSQSKGKVILNPIGPK